MGRIGTRQTRHTGLLPAHHYRESLIEGVHAARLRPLATIVTYSNRTLDVHTVTSLQKPLFELQCQHRCSIFTHGLVTIPRMT